PDLCTLQPGDEAALDAFLARHAESSMFLRSNARAAGLVDRGEPLQATYVAAVEGGAIVAVVAHCWNGMVLVQAPARVEAVTREAVRRSGRAVAGLSGPWHQVVDAREALGLGTTHGAPIGCLRPATSSSPARYSMRRFPTSCSSAACGRRPRCATVASAEPWSPGRSSPPASKACCGRCCLPTPPMPPRGAPTS